MSFVVQGSYSDGRICEEWTEEDEAAARKAAFRLLHANTFEGTQTRVITTDGELIWDSNPTGLMADDECPNCQNGTLEDQGDGFACRGECGAFFKKDKTNG